MSRLIGTILTSIIPKEHLWKIKLFNGWDSIIGHLKDKVRIEKIDETSLTLGVCHATWAQELVFLSPIIKKKINSLLREDKIKNISFKTVRFKREHAKGITLRERYSLERKKMQKNLSVEQCLTITEHNILKTINNSELEKALEQFCLRCKKTHKNF